MWDPKKSINGYLLYWKLLQKQVFVFHYCQYGLFADFFAKAKPKSSLKKIKRSRLDHWFSLRILQPPGNKEKELDLLIREILILTRHTLVLYLVEEKRTPKTLNTPFCYFLNLKKSQLIKNILLDKSKVNV